MQQRILKIVILPANEPIFSERATTIEIDDMAGGEFVNITQNGRDNQNGISIDLNEWEHVKNGIDFMIKQIKEFDKD